MASLHAAPLIALLLATPAPARTRGTTVTLGATPGAVIVANLNAGDRWFERALLVERRLDGQWRTVPTRLDLIAQCGPGLQRRTAPVRLRPGQRVAVPRWTGYSCAGQCPTGCRFDTYAGPGTFRVVARGWPGGERIASPAFLMPPTPPRAPVDATPLTLDAIATAARRRPPGPNEP